ncbi:phosphoserine phosphatase SerB [Acidithiobacillus marinus]|uniref:Phosphoserine phosphatase n=1 Tax=Acidithiobacillus marinus TaxID=187490 RepID=A0A2I1DQC6_9PROT|nr:phosphoserine phosphatase SerB [Acidithiobacillus marinus]PKY12082.1 phosphoserine phosphatase SerB [Acidithiobacillus marinus]
MSSTRLALLSPVERGPMTLPASMGQFVQRTESHQQIWGSWLQSWHLPVAVSEIMPFLDELSRQALHQDREVFWSSMPSESHASRLVLRGPLHAEALRRALTTLHLQNCMPGRILHAHADSLAIAMHGPQGPVPAFNRALTDALEGIHVDLAITPVWEPGHFRLLLTDMDSTLISIECIDELADHLGFKRQVAAITERSMAGELDFQTSLRERVCLLQGTPASTIDAIIRERLQLSPGARELIQTAKAQGLETGVVSGGFTQFTRHLQEMLDLDYAFANTLEIVDGKITGQVLGDIVDADAKADILELLAISAGTDASHCIAIGDGANDLPMLRKAGVGIAYHAKAVVRAQADFQIRYGGLDTAADFLGWY